MRYRRGREWLERALTARTHPLALHGVPAGLHGLIELPGGRDVEADVVDRAAKQGLALVGLSRFRVPGTEDTTRCGLVVGYARPPAHAYRGALATLLRILPK